MRMYWRWAVRALTTAILVAISVVVILLAINNRAPVQLDLWPWPWDLQLPIYLLSLGCLLLGFFLGAFAVWRSGAQTRRKARLWRRELDEKTREVSELRKNAVTAAATSSGSQELLPYRKAS